MDLSTDIIILSALVQKLTLIVKNIFWRNGGKFYSIMYGWRTNGSICFDLHKGLNPSYLVLKHSDILLSSNWDIAQRVILQGQGYQSKQITLSVSLTVKSWT